MKVETHREANATLALPKLSNAFLALVSTSKGSAFESDKKMKMDWIGKQHKARVDALSVNKHTPLPWTMSAIPGDNCIMHKGCIIAKVVGWPGIADEEFDGNKDFIVRAVNTIDDLTRQRDELIELSKAVLEAYDGCECLEGEKITKNHCPWCLLGAAIAAAERGQK